MTRTVRTVDEQRSIIKELVESITPAPGFDPDNHNRRAVGGVVADALLALLIQDTTAWLRMVRPGEEDLRQIRSRLEKLVARQIPSMRPVVLVSRDPSEQAIYVGLQPKTARTP